MSAVDPHLDSLADQLARNRIRVVADIDRAVARDLQALPGESFQSPLRQSSQRPDIPSQPLSAHPIASDKHPPQKLIIGFVRIEIPAPPQQQLLVNRALEP